MALENIKNIFYKYDIKNIILIYKYNYLFNK